MSKNLELLQRTRSRGAELISPRPTLRPNFGKEPDDSAWTRALDVLRNRRGISIAFAAFVIVSTVIVSAIMTPIYEPVALVEVSPPGTEQFALQNGAAMATDSEYLETQAKSMQSDRLAIEVIRELRLDENKAFMQPTLLGMVMKPFRKIANGVQHLLRPRSSDGSNVSLPSNLPKLTGREADALETFKSRVTVKRDTASRLIMVSCATPSPRTSALVVATLLKDFIHMNLENRHNAVEESSKWLARQLDDVHQKMEQSSRALADFQEATGIVDTDTNKSTVSEQMAEQGRQLTLAQTDSIQLQAYLNRVQDGNASQLPQVGSDLVVQQLIQRLAQARADLSQATPIYGKNHPLVQRLENQVDEFQKQLDGQRAAILAQLRTSYAAARARKSMLTKQMKDTSQQMVILARYNTLKREAQTNSDLYNTLFEKVKEAGINAEAKSSNVQIVSSAQVLGAPSRPNWPLNLGFALAVAIVGGLLIPFAWEKLDHRIYDVDEIRHRFGTPNVSIVPLARGKTGKTISGTSWPLLPLRNGKQAGTFILARPQSAEAEAIRSLYSSILMSRSSSASKVLLVTSALPGEGKTTLAVNLAIALARHGKTCILDADLRRPWVGKMLGLSDRPGLADVLNGQAQLDDGLAEVTQVPNLSVITGAVSANHHPAELVLSDHMRTVIDALRQKFEFVVIDSPPILPYSEGRVLSALADNVVFVSRFGATTREALNRGMELMASCNGAPVTELVLNGTNVSSSAYKYFGYGKAESA